MSGIIGSCESLKRVLELSLKVAKTDSLVLIYGETGVGKELFAKYIMENSLRRGKPYVVMNCASIPANLLESELFGHKKGAFSDAYADNPGRLSEAEGGTLFLDEIGELEISLQAKLLRFIQYGTFERLGQAGEISSDIRLIVATNKNLSGLVADGKMREDFYHRINVIPIVVPPLRERSGDLMELANFFAAGYSRKYGIPFECFDDSAVKKLSLYRWPGNVRELQNVIERTIVLSRSGVISGDDIVYDGEADYFSVPDIHGGILPYKDALDEFRRVYLVKALDSCRWNQTKTAKVLGIQRTYLSKLIKELGISKI